MRVLSCGHIANFIKAKDFDTEGFWIKSQDRLLVELRRTLAWKQMAPCQAAPLQAPTTGRTGQSTLILQNGPLPIMNLGIVSQLAYSWTTCWWLEVMKSQNLHVDSAAELQTTNWRFYLAVMSFNTSNNLNDTLSVCVPNPSNKTDQNLS